MDTSIAFVLAFAGVLATVIIGYIGVKYTIKYRKITDIIFLKNSCISLFNTVVRNHDNIEISFKGKKIDENLILFKGTFLNNGNVDIDKSRIHRPLEIELPDNYYWVTHKIIGSSNDFNVGLSLNGNKLIFNWDLFKEGEYITFDSLVEYKRNPKAKNSSDFNISRKLYEGLKFNHRITDLKEVDKETSLPRPESTKAIIIASTIILSIVTWAYYQSVSQFFFPLYKVLREASIESTQHYVELQAIDKSIISLVDVSGQELKVVSVNDVHELLEPTIRIQKENVNYLELVGYGLMATFFLLSFFSIMRSELRQKRLYRKLTAGGGKHNKSDYESDTHRIYGL